MSTCCISYDKIPDKSSLRKARFTLGYYPSIMDIMVAGAGRSSQVYPSSQEKDRDEPGGSVQEPSPHDSTTVLGWASLAHLSLLDKPSQTWLQAHRLDDYRDHQVGSTS